MKSRELMGAHGRMHGHHAWARMRAQAQQLAHAISASASAAPASSAAPPARAPPAALTAFLGLPPVRVMGASKTTVPSTPLGAAGSAAPSAGLGPGPAETASGLCVGFVGCGLMRMRGCRWGFRVLARRVAAYGFAVSGGHDLCQRTCCQGVERLCLCEHWLRGTCRLTITAGIEYESSHYSPLLVAGLGGRLVGGLSGGLF